MKPQQSYMRVITMSFIGNALEFYDFTLYGVFAMKMGQVFFPLADPLASLLASLAAFASGFLMRPVGAILFGHIGDKFGRKTALTVSIIGIGFPTVTIGLTPSYAEIGILAPIIVVASRLVQGICTGGEYNGAAIYCLEELQNKRPGFFSSFLTSAAGFGVIIAIFLGGYFGEQEWEGAWRVPFILGFFISFLGLWLRSKISESREFQDQSVLRKPIPMIAMLKEYRASSIKTFTAGAMNGLMAYTTFAFLTIFLTRYGSLPKDINLVYLNVIGMSFYMFINPAMGHLYDKIGEAKYITLMTILLCTVPLPAFVLLAQPSLLSVVIAQALLGTCTASIGGVALAISQKQFPTLIRYRGIAFNFSLGMGLAGGTVGMIHLYLIEKTKWIYIPSLYIFVGAIFMYLLFKNVKTPVAK
jgi:MHS family proline/betaine transporter-like MFS transporter